LELEFSRHHSNRYDNSTRRARAFIRVRAKGAIAGGRHINATANCSAAFETLAASPRFPDDHQEKTSSPNLASSKGILSYMRLTSSFR
jgi:hypothetical protein